MAERTSRDQNLADFDDQDSGTSTDSEDKNQLSRFELFVDKKKLKRSIQDHGYVEGLHRFLNDHLETWKSRKLHVAIAGQTGVGKSSLINALKGIKDTDRNAAKVGMLQHEVREYSFPTNDRVILHEIPGIGTIMLTRDDNTLEQIKLREMDVVIIVCAIRFHENDIWLAKECRSMGKKVFYVRTKIDTQNAKEDCAGGFDERECLKTIRKDMIKAVEKVHENNENIPIFLISSKHRREYDFQLLLKKLDRAFDTIGSDIRQIIVEEFKEIISLKEEELKRGFYGSKAWSMTYGFLPIPGLETVLSPISLLHIQEACLKHVGISEEVLHQISRELETSKDELKLQLISFEIKSFEDSAKVYENHEKNHLNWLKRNAKYFIPIFGSFYSAYKEFQTTCHFLEVIAGNAREDATTLVIKLMEKLQKDLSVNLSK